MVRLRVHLEKATIYFDCLTSMSFEFLLPLPEGEGTEVKQSNYGLSFE